MIKDLPPLPWSCDRIALPGEKPRFDIMHIIDRVGNKIAVVYGRDGNGREKQAIAEFIVSASHRAVNKSGENEQQLLEAAYVMLLRLPHDSIRARLQHVLATLRDEISTITGRAEEDVQNMFEEHARWRT